MRVMLGLLKTGRQSILNDFLHFHKTNPENGNAAQTNWDYFDAQYDAAERHSRLGCGYWFSV
jgi:hypothetical protein